LIHIQLIGFFEQERKVLRTRRIYVKAAILSPKYVRRAFHL